MDSVRVALRDKACCISHNTYLVRHHPLEALIAGLLNLDAGSTKKEVTPALEAASIDTPTGQGGVVAGREGNAERPPYAVEDTRSAGAGKGSESQAAPGKTVPSRAQRPATIVSNLPRTTQREHESPTGDEAGGSKG